MRGDRPFGVSMITSVMDLGGVQVQVTGPPIVTPAQPDTDDLTGVWPTSRMAMYTSVLMSDGKRWQVFPVPRYTQPGDVVVVLRAPAPSKATIQLTVPAAHLDVPIWTVGQPLPSARPAGQPTEEHDDTPPPTRDAEAGIWTG